MRKLLATGFVFLLMSNTAAPAAAQDYKPVDINIGFGWTFPTADFKNSFDAGWNGTFGVALNNGTDLAVTFTPVPEPGGLAVAGLAAVGLLARRRRWQA